jgi:hypothetical protein
MNDDIRALKIRQTTPRTWRDWNHNTLTQGIWNSIVACF